MRAILAGSALAALAAAAVAAEASLTGAAGVLAVCADPGNLPYSSQKLDGFENRIAALLAADMHRELRYEWAPQRRNFFARTLLARNCDLVLSVPASLPAALPAVAVTRPWFTSAYVAVTRAADHRRFAGFDDPWLTSARIGLQLIGTGEASTPPAMALAARGLTAHITGFLPWNSATDAPQAAIVDAVAHNVIDVALIWGPFAGYFAKPYGPRLHIDTITGDAAAPGLAFSFPMAAATRREDTALRNDVQAALDRNETAIAAILKADNIPLTSRPATRP